MGIVVIEEGHPNGTDLVVGAHLRNPVAQANAAPQRRIEVLPIGENYVVAGVAIEPVLSDDKDHLCVVLSVVGGRASDLVPTIPVKLVLGELARVKLEDLRGKLAAAIDGPKEPQ